MADITHLDPVVTESKLTDFYNDIKPFLGCPAYLTSEGNAEYYSTDEKVIGKWTDGKPLYEKIVTFSYPTTSKSWKNEAVLDTTCSIVLFNAYIYGVSNGLVPVPNPYNQTLFIVNASYVPGSGWSNKNGNFAMLTEATEYLGANGIALVKYTKTTDNATTTIQEDPNEYSTDEKIIGKWIDGKPLYQCTFTNLNVSIPKFEWNSSVVDVSSLNIKYLVDAKIQRTGGTGLMVYIPEEVTHENGKICICGNNSTRTIHTLTIQYTKTTD